MQAEQLVRHGLVVRIGGADAASETMLNMVAMADLDEFLARFRARGMPVDGPGIGMRNVIDTARVVRWPVVDIVRLVLDGGLSRIELLDETQRFVSVLVDPDEVRRELVARHGRGRVSLSEAAAQMKLSLYGVRALMSECDRDGPPVLKAVASGDPSSTQRYWFDPDDLERFTAGHVELAVLARERGASPKALRKRLSDAGIEPILPRPRINKLVYRRADL